MFTHQLPGSHDASQIVEQQMRVWAMQMETQRRQAEQAGKVSPKQLIHPCVTISRESGVDAASIANLVAAENNWKVLDRGILDQMAERFNWSRDSLDYVDEQTASWFHEVFGKWLDAQSVSQTEFVHRLGKIVLMAAQHEITVFVGRGARLILPRDLDLAVRIIAPKKMRIQRITELRRCNREAAEKFIDYTDDGRASFVKRYFHVDVADPKLYDLVINLEFTSADAAAKLILNHYKLRFGLG